VRCERVRRNAARDKPMNFSSMATMRLESYPHGIRRRCWPLYVCWVFSGFYFLARPRGGRREAGGVYPRGGREAPRTWVQGQGYVDTRRRGVDAPGTFLGEMRPDCTNE
jgi:hypothetical protein